MPDHDTDRTLLVGILALQMGFVSRAELVAAMRIWAVEKNQRLEQVLLDNQCIEPDAFQLLIALVNKHLQIHENDPEKSLQALSSIGSLRQELQSLQDPSIEMTLTLVSAAHHDEPSQSLETLTVGAVTSVGPITSTTSTDSRYSILRPHATGGLGAVFVARDEELSRDVALKEIQSRYADDVDCRARFKLEAEVTAVLEHPGIIPVYGMGQYADGRPYYVMRFIHGDSLRDAIKRFYNVESTVKKRTVAFRNMLSRLIDVCNAIEFAHTRGVLHRDLKPGNIMLGKYGETLVVDWGLVRVSTDSDSGTEQPNDSHPPITSSDSSARTRTGSAIGTPAFMSPEQASGDMDRMGPLSDVYSLGATLYCILTGRPPFDGRDVDTVLQAVKQGDFPRPRKLRPEIAKTLEAICLKAMALQPGKRYQSAAALAEDIEQWLADEPVSAYKPTLPEQVGRWTRRHRSWVLAGMVMLLLITTGSIISALLIDRARRQAIVAKVREAQQRVAAQQARDEEMRQTKSAEAARKKAEELSTQNQLLATAERDQRIAAERARDKEIKQAEIAKAARKRAEELATQNQMLVTAERDQRFDAERARDQERIQKTLAVQAKLVSERRAYNSDMLLAQRDWEIGSFRHLTGLLDQYRDRNDLKDFEWGHWDRLAHNNLLTLDGLVGDVSCVAFSPDGTRLTLTHGKWVEVRNAATGQIELTLEGHNERLLSMAFSSGGTRLATASWDKTVKIWDTATGQEQVTLKGHTSYVQSVAFSPNGTRVASAGGDKSVKVWEASTGRELLTFKGHNNGAYSVAFSPDGTRIASGGTTWDSIFKEWDHTIKVWDVVTGRETLTLQGHNLYITCVAFSPDGTRIASSSGDETVKVWNAATGRETITFTGHTGIVNSVAFSPDGKRIASGGQHLGLAGVVKVWDVTTGQETLPSKGQLHPVNSVAFSPDGTRLASASDKLHYPRETGVTGVVSVWASSMGLDTLSIKGDSRYRFSSVVFAPDGTRLAGVSSDNTVRIWNAVTGRLEGLSAGVTSVSFSPGGRFMAAASKDKSVKVWNAVTGQLLRSLEGHRELVSSVSFSPDGRFLASASKDETVKVWDAVTGQLLQSLEGHISGVSSVSFSPDGNWIASGDGKLVKVWDAATGKVKLTFNGGARRVVFSPDGTRLAGVSSDPTVLGVWDAVTGQLRLTFAGHSGVISSMAFSPNGMRLATASRDETVKIWDATSGQETLTLKGHKAPIESVAFSPDGTRIAVADWKEVKVWDSRPWTAELRAESQARELLTVYRERVKSLKELQLAIRSNQTISEMVRQQALDWSELFWKNR
ncbi:MAG: PD40 domain-containing protein [Planctomycetaceae bacterium]|nr:PD40 domain-containing protein [Planctomycetales bacterium]MCB9924366.1 PD40 domain-containing protein [Planctomycetaceae bacterium]